MMDKKSYQGFYKKASGHVATTTTRYSYLLVKKTPPIMSKLSRKLEIENL